MNKLNLLTKHLLCGAFLLGAPLQIAANEVTEPKAVPTTETTQEAPSGREAGTRAMSTKADAFLRERLFVEAKEHEAPKATTLEEILAEDETSDEERVSHNGQYFTSHLGASHQAFYIAPLGDEVELEDGSSWTVAHGDRYKVYNWLLVSDVITVSQNDNWFSKYSYILENQNTGDIVEADIRLAPLASSPYTYRITGIDASRFLLTLNDGSIWSFSSFDEYSQRNWYPGDRVIIGVNRSWNAQSFHNILIDAETAKYIRVECL